MNSYAVALLLVIQMKDPRRFQAVTIVESLIKFAYRIKDFQLLEAPDWLGQERFEVQATAGRPSSEDEIRQMVQGLLADRFKLKLHRETREIPIYALVVGKNGPKLRAAKDTLQTGDGDIGVGPRNLCGRAVTMDLFAMIRTTNLDRPVFDKTGLPGRYDFELTYDELNPAPSGASWAPIGPAIFTPIQELGLRLEPQKSVVEMLVIDSVDKPPGN